MAKRQLLVNGVDFPLLHLIDLADVRAENLEQTGIVKPVEAVVGGGWEAATFFVTSTGTGVKSLDAVTDAPLNGGVVAGVKVEAVNILVASPVAPVEHVALVDTEGHAGRLPVIELAVSSHKQHSVPVVEKLVKKPFSQVLAPPPAKLVAGILVEAVHSREQRFGNLVAGERLETDASGCHRFALPLDVAALVGVEDGQVVIKSLIALILPNIAVVQPAGEAVAFQLGSPDWIDKQKIAARDTVARAEMVNGTHHQTDQLILILIGRDQEAIALSRSERAHAYQLGIVFDPQPAGQICPLVVKDKLAGAVALNIQRRGGNQVPVAPHRQVIRQPAGFRRGAVGGFHIV